MPLDRLRAKIHEAFEPIAFIYYVYMLVFILGSAGSFVWKQFQANPWLSHSGLAVALVSALGWVAMLPFVVVNLRSAPHRPKTNPHLSIEKLTNELVVQEDGWQIVETTSVRAAREGVQQYALQFWVTGSAKVDVDVTRGGDLLGPTHTRQVTTYYVSFPNALKDGQTHPIELEYRLSDPEHSLKPFLTQGFQNFRSAESYEVSVKFRGVMPLRVYWEVHDALTGVAREPIVQLPIEKDHSVRREVPAVHKDYDYTVSWVLAESFRLNRGVRVEKQ